MALFGVVAVRVLSWSCFIGFEPVWKHHTQGRERPLPSDWRPNLRTQEANKGIAWFACYISQFVWSNLLKAVASLSLSIISMLTVSDTLWQSPVVSHSNGFGRPPLRPTSLRVPYTTWAPQREATQIRGWRRQKSVWAGYLHDLRVFDWGHFRKVKLSESLK